MRAILLIFFISLVLTNSHANESYSAEDIVKKVEDNLNAKTNKLSIEMLIQTKRHKRKIKLDSFSIGDDKTFIRINYPKKDKGITFLKLKRKMWQFVPKIEKIIKIPSSMAFQNWMGSDFSNDDLIKSNSFSKDYKHKILSENLKHYQLELIPNEDAAIIWGKLIIFISKEFFLPTKIEYYDEDSVLIRVLYYKNIKQFKEHYYPSLWEMVPQTPNKKGHKTTVKIISAIFNEKISSAYFKHKALRMFSK